VVGLAAIRTNAARNRVGMCCRRGMASAALSLVDALLLDLARCPRLADLEDCRSRGGVHRGHFSCMVVWQEECAIEIEGRLEQAELTLISYGPYGKRPHLVA
jgi:hypothetical protein